MQYRIAFKTNIQDSIFEFVRDSMDELSSELLRLHI